MTNRNRKIITAVMIVVAIPIAIGSFLVYGCVGPLAVAFVVCYILGVYIYDYEKNEKKLPSRLQ